MVERRGMATSNLLNEDGESTNTDRSEDKQKKEFTNGTICGLYNQYGMPNGTKCSIECYLPSTKEYIVIISLTNSRMIVNEVDVRRYDEISINTNNDNESADDASPTNEQLIKRSSNNLKSSSSKNNNNNNNKEQDYEKMSENNNRNAVKTRKTIIISITSGVCIILIGLIMYISSKKSVKTGGIVMFVIGVLVTICGVCLARFRAPPVQYFSVNESL